MPKFDFNDSGVVVIIGSGAGGGTLAHELTRRGIKVVLLEAGARQNIGTFSQVPGEAFVQLTWLDPRTQSGNWSVAREFPTLPSWTAKTVGGTTVHWTATTPRNQAWEIAARTTYGAIPGTSLIDWPIKYEELEKYCQLAEQRLHAILKGVTEAAGATGEVVRYERGAPATINNVELTRATLAALERATGQGKVQLIPPAMGSEDFSYFANEVPGFFYRLGQVKPGTRSGDHHTPTYLADDGAVPVGIRVMSHVLFDYLSRHK